LVNIYLGFGFVAYLCIVKPFADSQTNPVNILNELTYVIISLHQICFTDYVTDPETKNLVGWSMVVFSVLNMLFPNLYLVLAEMAPEITKLLSRKNEIFMTRKELR